jgi:two-component system LytT family response regulator
MLKADGYCTSVFLTNDVIITSSRNLQYFENLINPLTFMRVHHSFIINLEHVRCYTFQEEIILTNNLKCSLSRINKKAFKDYFMNTNQCRLVKDNDTF